MRRARSGRRVVLTLLLVMGLVLLPMAASAQAPSTRTSIQFFLPFNSGGLVIGLAVTGRDTGSCFAGSIADSGRPDAWRCMGNTNQIHDPCFENPYHTNPNVLACAQNPFDANVVLFTLTKPLPTEQANKPNTTAPPWALALANGAHCTPLTGTSVLIAGIRVNYDCTNAGNVLGEPNRGTEPWRVHYFTNMRSDSTTYVDVVTAWY